MTSKRRSCWRFNISSNVPNEGPALYVGMRMLTIWSVISTQAPFHTFLEFLDIPLTRSPPLISPHRSSLIAQRVDLRSPDLPNSDRMRPVPSFVQHRHPACGAVSE